MKRQIQRAGHHQPEREPNDGKQAKRVIQRAGHQQPGGETTMTWDTSEDRQPKSRTPRARLGVKGDK